MYLRLRGAGIFYKVLNTPQRIDVIEQMGHLDREDADFLREAATFYRALDHGQRIVTGHAEGSLPTPAFEIYLLADAGAAAGRRNICTPNASMARCAISAADAGILQQAIRS